MSVVATFKLIEATRVLFKPMKSFFKLLRRERGQLLPRKAIFKACQLQFLCSMEATQTSQVIRAAELEEKNK